MPGIVREQGSRRKREIFAAVISFAAVAVNEIGARIGVLVGDVDGGYGRVEVPGEEWEWGFGFREGVEAVEVMALEDGLPDSG